ncbi:MAG: type II toxin-antitoxin system HicB family antitoxin [Phycisphaerae bacterium]|nr:type II toxin-antitoxin system HicB family antitoxin [Planctomycetota bacterium]MBL7220128.1 type II toxin-antitoxin system HicB family antitoxin [Phycisphaerae bacterium]
MKLKTTRYVHWQNKGMWLGYLEDYPDYITQARSIKELQENLKDLYADLTGGHIPGVRKVAELQIV